MSNTRFTLTEQHLKLLQRMWVGWDDAEFGAPAIDPKRPYGNRDVLRDVGAILGQDEDAWPEDVQWQTFHRLHRETRTALQIVLSTQSFAPGVYECRPYSIDWRKVEP